MNITPHSSDRIDTSQRAGWDTSYPRKKAVLWYLEFLHNRMPVGLRLRSRDHTRLDTALQAVIPIGTFGAALAFSTLYSAGRAGADAKTVRYLAWAFALYLCAAILSLNTRLGVNIDPHNQMGMLGTQLRQFAFMLGVLSSLAATMLMAISLTSNFHDNAVRGAGFLATAVVGYAGVLTVEHASLYAARDYAHKMHLALLHVFKSPSGNRLEESSSLQFQPPKNLREEIEKFLSLHAEYGKALAHLTAGPDTKAQESDTAKSGQTGVPKHRAPFVEHSLEERARRLAYAAMAFNRAVRFQKDNKINNSVLDGARDFLAEDMRKWDKILHTLVKEDEGEDNWWQSSRPCQVLRIWWLYEAQGGGEEPLDTAMANAQSKGEEDAAEIDAVQEPGAQQAVLSDEGAEGIISRPESGPVAAALHFPSSADVDLEAQNNM